MLAQQLGSFVHALIAYVRCVFACILYEFVVVAYFNTIHALCNRYNVVELYSLCIVCVCTSVNDYTFWAGHYLEWIDTISLGMQGIK